MPTRSSQGPSSSGDSRPDDSKPALPKRFPFFVAAGSVLLGPSSAQVEPQKRLIACGRSFASAFVPLTIHEPASVCDSIRIRQARSMAAGCEPVAPTSAKRRRRQCSPASCRSASRASPNRARRASCSLASFRRPVVFGSATVLPASTNRLFLACREGNLAAFRPPRRPRRWEPSGRAPREFAPPLRRSVETGFLQVR